MLPSSSKRISPGHTMSAIRDHRSSIGTPFRRQMASSRKIQFQLPSNLKGTLLNYTNGLDHRPYEHLVCLLRDADVKDEELCALLQDAQDCVSLLDQNLTLFVQVLLVVKWAHRGPEAVAAYQSFLLDLCSAHSYHTKVVLDHLISHFKGVNSSSLVSGEELEWSSGQPSPEEGKMFDNVHHVLLKLLKVVPMAGELLMPSLISAFPYFKRPTREHQAYIHNMLEILKYQPKFRQEFLHLIVNKLIQLDVHAPRSDIEAEEEEEEEDDGDGDGDGDEAMDLVSNGIFTMDQEESMKHPVANTLDHLMLRLFKYFQTECTDSNTNEITLEKSYSLYKDLIQTFEKLILPTHNTHHVQFLVWYLCSLRPKIAEVFVKHLWQVVSGVSVAPVTRQSAAAYVASFLARAKFIKTEFLKVTLKDMSDWIHKYINNQDGQNTIEIRLHTVFYSVCQALFYLLCFRHKELFRTKQNMVFLQGLNLTKIITSSLNPLKVCLPEVVKKFAAITRAYQLVYCNSVIERNSRSAVPVVQARNHISHTHVDQPSNWLDTFFPFDPYILRRSSALIIPHYNEYKDDVNEESVQKTDNDDDDFLHEPLIVNVDKRFTYSSSPGFLQDNPMISPTNHLGHFI